MANENNSFPHGKDRILSWEEKEHITFCGKRLARSNAGKREKGSLREGGGVPLHDQDAASKRLCGIGREQKLIPEGRKKKFYSFPHGRKNESGCRKCRRRFFNFRGSLKMGKGNPHKRKEVTSIVNSPVGAIGGKLQGEFLGGPHRACGGD